MLVGGLFASLGAVLLALAVVRGIATRRFTSGAAAADGTVLRLLAGGSHPEIGFVTQNNQEVKYAQGGFIFGYKVGDQVRVLYAPADPGKTVCVDRFGALWFTPVLLGVLSILFIAGGLGKILSAI